MRNPVRSLCYSVVLMFSLAMLALSVAGQSAFAEDLKVNLAGAEEVPAVTTSANGGGTITVGEDHTVSGRVTTTGVPGTAAHIHMGAPGQNGPVVIPLTKTDDNTWTVPSGAKLTDQQYEAYQAGNLYVNVHSAAHPSGEIRTQLKPQG